MDQKVLFEEVDKAEADSVDLGGWSLPGGDLGCWDLPEVDVGNWGLPGVDQGVWSLPER